MNRCPTLYEGLGCAKSFVHCWCFRFVTPSSGSVSGTGQNQHFRQAAIENLQVTVICHRWFDPNPLQSPDFARLGPSPLGVNCTNECPRPRPLAVPHFLPPRRAPDFPSSPSAISVIECRDQIACLTDYSFSIDFPLRNPGYHVLSSNMGEIYKGSSVSTMVISWSVFGRNLCPGRQGHD